MNALAMFGAGIRACVPILLWATLASTQNQPNPPKADDPADAKASSTLVIPAAASLSPNNATEAFAAAIDSVADRTLSLKAVGDYEHAVLQTFTKQKREKRWLLIFAAKYVAPEDASERVKARHKALREAAHAARVSLATLARPGFPKRAALDSN